MPFVAAPMPIAIAFRLSLTILEVTGVVQTEAVAGKMMALKAGEHPVISVRSLLGAATNGRLAPFSIGGYTLA